KAPPPHTPAFHEIATASSSPEASELEDVLATMRFPDATTLAKVAASMAGGGGDFATYVNDRPNPKPRPRWFEQAGYVAVPNPDNKQGNWMVDGKRQIIFARAAAKTIDHDNGVEVVPGLATRDRFAAARKLAEKPIWIPKQGSEH